MTPLLQARPDAVRVGFDAPKCQACDGAGELADETRTYVRNCCRCHATGLDASDPYGLMGRAMVWLWSHERNATDAEYPNISAAIRDAETGCGMRGLKLVDDYKFERHDGTPTGLATALLRLVARVGAPHPQTAPETRKTETT